MNFRINESCKPQVRKSSSPATTSWEMKLSILEITSKKKMKKSVGWKESASNLNPR